MLKLCDLDSTKLDKLSKLVTIMENCEYIAIRNGKINHMTNTAIISGDLNTIFGDTFDIDIINPKKISKLLKLMVRKNVTVYDDGEMHRFILSNNEMKLFLPKKQSIPETPKIKISSSNAPITIKDNKKTIRNFIGTTEVKLLIHEGKLKGLLVDDVGMYTFPEYSDENVEENSCDIYVVYNFLPFESEEYTINVIKDTKNKMWLYTKIAFEENVSIFTLENINKKTIENLLI